MTSITNTVHGYLLRNCQGKQNARTLKKISEDLGYRKRTVEKAIEDIREHQLSPVCGESRTKGQIPGQYIALVPEELNQFYSQIESRIRKLCIHKAQLKQLSVRLWGKEPSEQLNLFEPAL